MNRALTECIVEALCVTGPFEESLERLGTFSKRDWQQTLPWLDDSGLALYLLERMDRSGSPRALPVEIGAYLRRNLASNQERLTEMKKEFGSLNSRFQAAGAAYAVLKGFALIPDYCPDAVLRSQYDYDYLVHPDSIDLAQQSLQAAGYSQKVKSPGFEKIGASLFAAQPLSLPSPNQDFYSASLPRSVELHLSLWEPNQDMISLEVPRDTLDRRRIANWEGLQFPVLADDDALLFQTLHAFGHVLSYWCRPSYFLEIAYFIARRHSDRIFWEEFRSRVGGHKYLSQIVGLVFSIAATLFKAPIPAEVSAWTAGGLRPALSYWVQHHGRTWALAPFPGNKLSLFVHREFIEDPGLWKAVKWSRLFPFHRPAHVVEPNEPSLTSHWLASWKQAHYVLSRLKFHLGGLLSYTWELPRWKQRLRRLDRGG